MKTFLFTMSIVFCSIFSTAQTAQPTPVRYFAQAMMQNLLPQDVSTMITELNNNPNIYIVRYDELTNGLLVITNEMTAFDQAIFNSWLTGFSGNVECYRQGLQGLDTHIGFTSDFCNNL